MSIIWQIFSLASIISYLNHVEVVVKPEGRLDTLTSRELEGPLLEACDQTGKVILDLSEVPYIFSAGLRLVIQAYKKMKDKQGLQVTNACEQVREVFEMTGYDHVVKMV